MEDRQDGRQDNYPSSSQQPPSKKARYAHDEDLQPSERNIPANPYDHYRNQQIDTHKSDYQLMSQFPSVHQHDPIRTSSETVYRPLQNTAYDPQFSQRPIQQSRCENLQQTSFFQPHQNTSHYGLDSEQTIPGGNAGSTYLPQEHQSQMQSDQGYSSRLSFIPSQSLTTSQEATNQPLDLSHEQNYGINYATFVEKGDELASDNNQLSVVETPHSPVSREFPDDWKTMHFFEKGSFCRQKIDEARMKGDKAGEEFWDAEYKKIPAELHKEMEEERRRIEKEFEEERRRIEKAEEKEKRIRYKEDRTKAQWVFMQTNTIYSEALQEGTYQSRRSRLMLVGESNVGKTTLSRGLIGLWTDDSHERTDGIDLLRAHCKVRDNTGKWETIERSEGEKQKLNEAMTIAAREVRSTKQDMRNMQQPQSPATKKEKGTKQRQAFTQTRESFLRKLVDLEEDSSVEIGDILIDIWDFAGQSVFYTTHQSFLTPRCVYILVINMALDLQSPVDDLGFSKEYASTVIEYFNFWVSTITTYASGSKVGFPRILVVGTHLDQVDDGATKVKYLIETISERYKGLVDRKQLILHADLFLNARDPTCRQYDVLRKLVIDESEKYPHWEEPYPKSWLHLQDLVISNRDKKKEIVALKDVMTWNKKSFTPLSEREVEAFLEVQHEFGNIVFFNTAELKGVVVLDPSVLIKALRLFVTSPRCKSASEMNAEIWKNLSINGVLLERHLHKIWQKGGAALKKNTNHMLRLFENMDVIVRPKTYINGEEKKSETLFVPCMVSDSSQEQSICNFLKENKDSYLNFCIEIENAIVPPAIGYRVLAFCVSTWPVMNDRLYLGCGVFRLDLFHMMIVRTSLPSIEVYICHRRSKKALSSSICSSVNEALVTFLHKTVSVYTTQFKINTGYVAEKVTLNKSGQCDKHCGGLPDECMSKRIDEIDLVRLARAIPEIQSLITIGTALGVEVATIEKIKADNPGAFIDQMFLVLREWKNTSTNGRFYEIKKTLEESEVDPHILCKIYTTADLDRKIHELLPTDVLENIPNAEELDQISNLVGKEILQFGIELGLQSATIERTVRENKHNILGAIRRLLQEWKKKEYKPTVKALGSAIYSCRLDFLAFCDLFRPCDLNDTWQSDWR